MPYIRIFFRLIAFITITLMVALPAILLRFLGMNQKRVFVSYSIWKKCILSVMNIRITEEGVKPSTPGVIMSNHRSYVDIALTPSQIPFVIVAKKSVRSWPLVGQGADALRTIWVDRESKESRLETRAAMRDRLENGDSVLIFPEGTTVKGPEIGELKPGMFFTCAEGNFPIHPMAIEYENSDIAWIGNDLFIPHFVRNFGGRRIRVKVRYGPIIQGNDGEMLRLQMTNWLSKNLFEMRDEWDSKAISN